MNQLRRTAVLAGGALGLLAWCAIGCSKKVTPIYLRNEPPTVRLSQAPVDTSGRYFYAYRMNWVGFDPDGRVDYYLIAVDPNNVSVVDTSWSRTTKNEQIINFKASTPDTAQNMFQSIDYHVFAIRAVDNRGEMSDPVWRAFNAFTVAPSTTILTPRPNAVFDPIVPPSVRIEWTGVDPDGQAHTKPVKYKYKLFKTRNEDFPEIQGSYVNYVLRDPDVLRRTYAPTFGPSAHCPTCSYWDSTDADNTFKQYTNLTPGEQYLFVVTGFDEAGAYDPVFDTHQNMLKFVVTYAGTNGPRICMFNEFFSFCYDTGGYSSDESRFYDLEVPASQRVVFNWFAVPPQGSTMRRYRWVMDLQDLNDQTARSNEETDWFHWSQYSLTNTQAIIGPFEAGQAPHLFYIEAEDSNGLRSLGIIRFTVVRATFENDLLFVDDGRLTPDKTLRFGQVEPPEGEWPSAAELDTFLFARGGVPWRGYPEGTISQPGIFKGYGRPSAGVIGGGIGQTLAGDTVGTRGIPRGILPLSVLGKYKHVIWYTDGTGATFTGNPTDPFAPTTALRLMSTPGQPSTLSTYLKQGGTLWLMGGGAAMATLNPWNARGTPAYEYSEAAGELVPGRFMYDFPHWRSFVKMLPAAAAELHRHKPFPFPESRPKYLFNDPNTAPGRGGPDQPDYSAILNGPVQLQPRNPSTDPMPPLRDNYSQYYLSSYNAEYLFEGNFIREDADQLPGGLEESTLDTLYFTIGATAGSDWPVMTYYHGFETPAGVLADPDAQGRRARIVFSGFPLWYFQRDQQIIVADWVMQKVFHMQHDGSSRTLLSVPAARAARLRQERALRQNRPDGGR
jgi:hypothetical protein